MGAKLYLATDLDRTLFPNGKQPQDDSMPQLKQALSQSGLGVIFVTGRNGKQVREGIAEFDPPRPEFLIAEVGTKVYRCEGEEFHEIPEYVEWVRSETPGWDVDAFKGVANTFEGVRLQESHNQNEFKNSYYVNKPADGEFMVPEIEIRLREVCSEVEITYSVDETEGIGLLDVLPKRANKMEGMEFLRRLEGWEMDQFIYAGDSGNDVSALTFGYRAILVRNATDEVREQVREKAEVRETLDSIYFAKGDGELNGYYHSGVLEGLRHFGAV